MSNVTPLRPGDGPPPREPDAFDRIYDQMQAQIDSLVCVLATLEGSDPECHPQVSAAVGLLGRTYQALDQLRVDLGDWRMGDQT